MNNIRISIAKAEDSRAVSEVFYRTWLVTYPNKEYGITVDDVEDRFKERHYPESIQKRLNRISHPPKGETLLVAKEGSKVIGICRTAIKEEKNQLQAIYILPEYQGKGIGKMLWNEAQVFFDLSKDIFVELAVYNKHAERFYKSLGFIDTGKRIRDKKFTMKSGATILEMEMSLKRKGLQI